MALKNTENGLIPLYQSNPSLQADKSFLVLRMPDLLSGIINSLTRRIVLTVVNEGA